MSKRFELVALLGMLIASNYLLSAPNLNIFTQIINVIWNVLIIATIIQMAIEAYNKK